ncbi:MAG: phenylacetate--CoA ligase family protein [Rubrivivax sp.]|nr:phenylacetate--CoA ligase family protein [Rubrivivax sp.]
MTDFDPWHSARTAADVLTTTQGGAEAVATRQRQRLAALLEHARLHTRLHAERLRGLPADPPLAALPVLDKATLMARFDDSVADPALTLAVVRAFVADPARIGTPLLDRYAVWESSGTSGRPGLFVQDAQAMAVYDALEALRRAPRSAAAPAKAFNPLDPFGLFDAWGRWAALGGAGDRWAFVGAIDGHFASQASVQRLRRLNPWLAQQMRSFSILQPLPALVHALNDWAPTVLATYPTAAAMLADEARRGALRLPLRELLTGGETLGTAVRSHLGAAFGCPVHNSYGASEFLTIAADCAQGRLHVNADWVILEPVDTQDRPTPEGELSQDTLLTNLANRVQPLIRYRLGDRVRVLRGRCACGSPLPAIEVLGRHDDALHLAGRGDTRVTLLPLALSTVLEDEAGVFDFQLLQRGPRTLALRLGAGAAADAGAVARCRSVLRAFAHGQGVPSLRVLDETAQAPLRGRSGKVQRVVASRGA